MAEKRDLIREVCKRSVTIFMIRYLERKARAEMIRAYALFFPDRSRDDGEADETSAIV
jgi:hypothetical protein